MAFHLKSRRFQIRVAEPDPVADDEGNEKDMEESSDSSSSEVEAEFESMAAKGIKRLCSELLELKKAADEDFQRNVYENRSIFLKMSKEVEVVEGEVLELRRHVSTQKNLIQALFDNLDIDIPLEDTKNGDFYARDSLTIASPSAHREYVLEILDTFLSERRLDEALNVIEMEIGNLQKLQEEDGLSPKMIAYASALSDRRASLVSRFISMAGHCRVSVNELQKALSGLCRLAEDDQANVLLLNFYRSRLDNCVHDLQSSRQIRHGPYVIQLARTVFHIISLAARSFLKLYGETSSYTSELIQWAREETEAFGLNFNKYIKSVSETNVGFTLAVEAAKAVVYHCSVLKSQRLVLLRDLIKCIRPCMEEVLMKHVNHLKKLTSISAATDIWVICKHQVSGTFDKFFEGFVWNMEYCMLTSSGMKFITLVQAFVKDASSLTVFQMEGLILHGLVELFEDYIYVIRKAIPNTSSVQENEFLRINSAQELPQRLALLVNSSTVIQFLQCIGHNVIKGLRASNTGLSWEHSERTILKEFDKKLVSAQKTVDKLRRSFCHCFVEEILSDKKREETKWWGLYFDLLCPDGFQNVSVPTFPLQTFFLRTKLLQEHSKSVTVGDSHSLENLPKELLETVIEWFIENQDFWENARSFSEAQKYSPSKQFLLDLLFLMEIARINGHLNSNVKFLISGLISRIGPKYGLNDISISDVSQYKSELNSAKTAITKLQEYKVAELQLGDPNYQTGLALVPVDLDTYAETDEDFCEEDDEENRNTKKIYVFNEMMEDEVFLDTREDIASSNNMDAKYSEFSEPPNIAKEMEPEEDPELNGYLPIVESRWPKVSDKMAGEGRSDEEAIPQINLNLQLVVLTDSDLDELPTGADPDAFEDHWQGTVPSATDSKELVLFSLPDGSNPTETDVFSEIDEELLTASGSEFIMSDETITERSVQMKTNLPFGRKNFELGKGRTSSLSTSEQELACWEDEDDPGQVETPQTLQEESNKSSAPRGARANTIGFSYLQPRFVQTEVRGVVEEPDCEIKANSDVEETSLSFPAGELEDEDDTDVAEIPRNYLEKKLIGSSEYNYGARMPSEGKAKLPARKARFTVEEPDTEKELAGSVPRKPRFMQTKTHEIVEEPDSEMELVSDAAESPPALNPPEDFQTLEFLLNDSEGDEPETVESNISAPQVDYYYHGKQVEEERSHTHPPKKDNPSQEGIGLLSRTTSNARGSSDGFMSWRSRRDWPSSLRGSRAT